MSDSTRRPGFNDEDLAREREVVLGELDRAESSPFSSLTAEMMTRLFFKYPSRKKPGGTRQTVDRATTAMMRTIQSRYYVPNNSAIILTGDISPQAGFLLAGNLFRDWAKRPVNPFVEFPLVEHPPLPKSEGVLLTQPVENVIVEVAWQGPSIGKDTAATYAADVFSFILRQPNSHFQRALVDTGLVNGIDLSYYTQRNVGPITLTLQTTADKARAAMQALYAEIARFNDPTYFSDDELESAKALLEAEDVFARESITEYIHTIAFWWSSTGLDYFRGYLGQLRLTSRADIRRYVTTYIQEQPHVGIALLSDSSRRAAGLTAEHLIGGGK